MAPGGKGKQVVFCAHPTIHVGSLYQSWLLIAAVVTVPFFTDFE